jgi:signal transduction histidine kinase/CheY-like chemotaxis protein
MAYVVLSFAACIGGVGVVMATNTAASYDRERHQASAELIAAARYNADYETESLKEVPDILAGLAEQDSLSSLDPTRCAAALEGLASVAAQGSIYVLSSTRAPVCQLLAKRRPVVDVPEGVWFADVQRTQESQYGGVRLDATGVPQVIFAVPMQTPAGVGAVVAVIDTAVYPLEVPPNTNPKTVLVELDAARTTVIAASANASVKAGKLPANSWLRGGLGDEHTRTDSDGVVRIYEQVRVEGVDRVLLAGVPRGVAMHAATQERNRNALLGAVILILVAALGRVMQRSIARPVARLRDAIRDAGVDGSVQADLDGPAEIAGLADEFNATMAKRRGLERDLAASVARAEDASRMKSLFLANVSHEIRTPMNGVLGMIELLRGDRLSKRQREYLDTMDDSASALMSLLNDLLDFSKIEAGMVEVNVAEFPLGACVRAAVAPWVPAARNKGVDLTVVIDPAVPDEVRGDPMRVRQVLSNLVDNAVKFTLDGAVTVSVGVGDGDVVRFEVRDTGIGLGTQLSDQLFDAFVQGDPTTTRRFGGTGLGLAISKQLVTLMHGQIGTDPRHEGGSLFWFELPLSRVVRRHAEAPAVEAGSDAALHGTVLVAEDNVVNQKVAVALLKQLGLDVDVAVNGLEAVRMVEQGSYVAVFMDLQMPVMDGFEATAEIRNTLRASLPVFALSASALPEDQARCLEVGMNGHVSKPVSRDALRAALDAAMSSNAVVGARVQRPALLA